MNKMVSSNIKKKSSIITGSTGPGPEELIGYTLTNNDTQIAGFFGEVPTSEFIDGDALASMIGLTSGVSQNSTVPWLKFILDGKILFIPKMTIRHSISWDQINNANAVYGNREINILGHQFKVRLLQGINPGESVTVSYGFDLPETHQSEWNRLFYPICEDDVTYPKTSQVGPNWVTYTGAELNISYGYGGRTWCQETPSDSSTRRSFRGYDAVSSLVWIDTSSAKTYYGWRPVLELVSI